MDNMGKNLKTILVTGGNGLLGKEIYTQVSLNKNYFNFIFTSKSNIPFGFQCDLCNYEEASLLSSKISPNLIIHCAASVPKNNLDYQSEKIYEDNLKMVEHLIEFFDCQMIFMSSMTVYGNIEKESVSENVILSPSSRYAISKKRSEELLKNHSRPTISLRLPGLFSKRRKNGIIFNTINSIKNNNKIVLPESSVTWSAMNVEDAAQNILQLCTLNWKNYEQLNIGYSGKISINYFLDIISKYFNTNINYDIIHPTFKYDLSLFEKIGLKNQASFKSSIIKFIKNVF